MSDDQKRWMLSAIVVIAIAMVAYTGWRALTISTPPSQIFGASLFAVVPYAIATAVFVESIAGVFPRSLLPGRWAPARKLIGQLAGCAILVAVVSDEPPALWVAIAASTAGAWWMLGTHDAESEREEEDIASRAQPRQ